MPDNPFGELGKWFQEGLTQSVTQAQSFVFRDRRKPGTEDSRAGTSTTQPTLHPTDVSSSNAAKEQLGRATWTLLHTMAAQYPERPDKYQQKDIAVFIDVFSRTYPCAQCSQHFQEIIRKKPPKTSSARELRLWMCEVHNEVNQSLDKPSFNCNYVDARWKSCEALPGGACAIETNGVKQRPN